MFLKSSIPASEPLPLTAPLGTLGLLLLIKSAVRLAGMLWTKLAVNSVINPLTALFNVGGNNLRIRNIHRNGVPTLC